jgi:hypothetical protein
LHIYRQHKVYAHGCAGVVLPSPDYDSLTAAMKKQCVLLNLQPTDYFLMKTIQLYEMIVVRHGLMTVGQPFSGKSASLKVLAGKPPSSLIAVQFPPNTSGACCRYA